MEKGPELNRVHDWGKPPCSPSTPLPYFMCQPNFYRADKLKISINEPMSSLKRISDQKRVMSSMHKNQG